MPSHILPAEAANLEVISWNGQTGWDHLSPPSVAPHTALAGESDAFRVRFRSRTEAICWTWLLCPFLALSDTQRSVLQERPEGSAALFSTFVPACVWSPDEQLQSMSRTDEFSPDYWLLKTFRCVVYSAGLNSFIIRKSLKMFKTSVPFGLLKLYTCRGTFFFNQCFIIKFRENMLWRVTLFSFITSCF